MASADFRFLRGTPERWALIDPILDETEIAYERGSGKFKMGDGIRKWSDLPYFVPGSSSGGPTDQELLDHIEDLLPHPVYDDGPSLALLYENAKV